MAPEGVIIGGWNFVVAAYSVTAIVLFVYWRSLARRRRRVEREKAIRDE